ncbi:MAG: shikimate kinase [Clostridiales bacterium]|nr:shikimate kinase [Clostridiales bacterium]
MGTKNKENIILIGFMGCGKTSVGKRLAKRLNYPFVDTDHLIEKNIGCTINEIFSSKGEDFFREMETSILREIGSDSRHKVIATGGGLPEKKQNREILKEIGHVVYLKISKETVIKRLSGDTTRPKLKGDDLSTKVDALLREREPIYEEVADQVIETDDKSYNEIINLITNAMG